MNRDRLQKRLRGCYVTVPTLFRESDLEIDLPAIQRHVEFLISGGIQEGTGLLLAGGAAGDFSTMTLAERLKVAEAVISATDERAPVVVGAQTTNTRELVALAEGAQQLGADYIQISPPYYFAHTEQDFFEYVAAAAEAAPEIGMIVYNTYWTSLGVSHHLIDKLLCEIPSVVGLKWSVPDKGFMEFEACVTQYASELAIIDNQCRFVTSHMLGARSIETHIANHWPQWGVRLWKLLEEHQYVTAQREITHVALPFMKLWTEMEQQTSGDGYLDKLCMELVGLDSSRCRPPTRDLRELYRERVRNMLIDCGTPGVKPQGDAVKRSPIKVPSVQSTMGGPGGPHFPVGQELNASSK